VSESMDKAGKAVELVSKLIEAAGDNEDTKQAAKSLARSAKTVATTIEVCLLPFAAITFGYSKAREYFEKEFAENLSEKLNKIPLESIVEPQASVAAPIVQGLGFSAQEASLKEMYLNLLANSMDGREPNKAHPSFASIVGQLTPDEASFITGILRTGEVRSIVNLTRKARKEAGHIPVVRHLINVAKNNEVYWGQDVAFKLDNLQRLGLVEIDYKEYLSHEKSYDWVEGHKVYLSAQQDLGDAEVLQIQKGVMRLTHFGEGFLKAVIE
jgi:hypothetical protein